VTVAGPVVATVRDRPDVVERAWELTKDVFPAYNNEGDVLNVYWGRLTEELPEYQFTLLEGDEILARARSIPVRWDGTLDDLPAGIDGAIARGFDEGDPNVLCALVIMIPPALQGRGVSRLALEGMVGLAREHGLEALIAPVRPSWKVRYPLTPIESYAAWRRDDGSLFDPWMRVHERLGGQVLKPESRSLRITGTVADWESWTELAFPESGAYVFPGGLATVAIDREADLGSYWEPNVWMRHAVPASRDG
jgi:GNAT superfamily N-acetyltransferase